MRSADPAQESGPTDHEELQLPTRQLELDHTDHTDQEYICPEEKYLGHDVGMDYLSDVWRIMIILTGNASLQVP